MSAPRFHPEARREYIEAVLYVESQREGYGEKLEAELEATLRRVVDLPRSGTLVVGTPKGVEVRRFPLNRFRYVLMIVLEGKEPVVYAVAHQHRHPGYWLSRVPPR